MQENRENFRGQLFSLKNQKVQKSVLLAQPP